MKNVVLGLLIAIGLLSNSEQIFAASPLPPADGSCGFSPSQIGGGGGFFGFRGRNELPDNQCLCVTNPPYPGDGSQIQFELNGSKDAVAAYLRGLVKQYSGTVGIVIQAVVDGMIDEMQKNWAYQENKTFDPENDPKIFGKYLKYSSDPMWPSTNLHLCKRFRDIMKQRIELIADRFARLSPYPDLGPDYVTREAIPIKSGANGQIDRLIQIPHPSYVPGTTEFSQSLGKGYLLAKTLVSPLTGELVIKPDPLKKGEEIDPKILITGVRRYIADSIEMHARLKLAGAAQLLKDKPNAKIGGKAKTIKGFYSGYLPFLRANTSGLLEGPMYRINAVCQSGDAAGKPGTGAWSGGLLDLDPYSDGFFTRDNGTKDVFSGMGWKNLVMECKKIDPYYFVLPISRGMAVAAGIRLLKNMQADLLEQGIDKGFIGKLDTYKQASNACGATTFTEIKTLEDYVAKLKRHTQVRMQCTKNQACVDRCNAQKCNVGDIACETNKTKCLDTCSNVSNCGDSTRLGETLEGDSDDIREFDRAGFANGTVHNMSQRDARITTLQALALKREVAYAQCVWDYMWELVMKTYIQEGADYRIGTAITFYEILNPKPNYEQLACRTPIKSGLPLWLSLIVLLTFLPLTQARASCFLFFGGGGEDEVSCSNYMPDDAVCGTSCADLKTQIGTLKTQQDQMIQDLIKQNDPSLQPVIDDARTKLAGFDTICTKEINRCKTQIKIGRPYHCVWSFSCPLGCKSYEDDKALEHARAACNCQVPKELTISSYGDPNDIGSTNGNSTNQALFDSNNGRGSPGGDLTGGNAGTSSVNPYELSLKKGGQSDSGSGIGSGDSSGSGGAANGASTTVSSSGGGVGGGSSGGSGGAGFGVTASNLNPSTSGTTDSTSSNSVNTASVDDTYKSKGGKGGKGAGGSEGGEGGMDSLFGSLFGSGSGNNTASGTVGATSFGGDRTVASNGADPNAISASSQSQASTDLDAWLKECGARCDLSLFTRVENVHKNHERDMTVAVNSLPAQGAAVRNPAAKMSTTK